MSAAEPLYLPGFDAPPSDRGVIDDDAPIGQAIVADVAASPPVAPRTFAGLPIATIVLGALVLLLTLLSAWQTREILALRSHRIVSVSLAGLVHDFIATEAHNPGSPEVTAMRTRLYLAATQAAVRTLTEQGNTVLVSEAVAGNSAPDVTPAVKADIEAKLRAVQVSVAMGK